MMPGPVYDAYELRNAIKVSEDTGGKCAVLYFQKSWEIAWLHGFWTCTMASFKNALVYWTCKVTMIVLSYYEYYKILFKSVYFKISLLIQCVICSFIFNFHSFSQFSLNFKHINGKNFYYIVLSYLSSQKNQNPSQSCWPYIIYNVCIYIVCILCMYIYYIYNELYYNTI